MELFRPLGGLSAQAQLTPALSVAAQVFLEWEPYLYIQQYGTGPALDQVNGGVSRWGDYAGISPDADGRDWVVAPYGTQAAEQTWVTGTPS